MANDTYITVVGNLTSDPELRYTQNGLGVANFTVASTPRTFNKQTNEFEDGEATFWRCSVWRETAEYVSNSLTKGTRVIVQGSVKQRTYETKEGESRTSIEIDVEDIGPSLKYATAQVTRAVKNQNQANRSQQRQRQRSSQQPRQQAPAQQWASNDDYNDSQVAF